MTDRHYQIYRLAGYVHELVDETSSWIEADRHRMEGYTVVEVGR